MKRYFKRFSAIFLYFISWIFYKTRNHKLYIRVFTEYLRMRGAIIKGNPKYIGINCTLDFRGGIIFHEGVVISNEACLLTHDYSLNVLTKNYMVSTSELCRTESVELGANCFIGKRAIILPGVRIGAGSVVAAGAVVTKNVDPLVVVAGNPAKLIRKIK